MFQLHTYQSHLPKRYHIATAIYTGARRGEIAGLKWEDIDFEKRTMYIRRSVVKLAQQEPEIKLPKTISSIRQIAIPQALCDILQELKKRARP